jgi:anti-sigma B factor antagonist
VEIETKTLQNCEFVVLSGELDSDSAPALEQTLLSLLDAGKKNLVINLRGVTFISSSGLRALLTAHRQARQKIPRGRVAVSEIPSQLRKTFELVGMNIMFDLYDSDTEAIESF